MGGRRGLDSPHATETRSAWRWMTTRPTWPMVAGARRPAATGHRMPHRGVIVDRTAPPSRPPLGNAPSRFRGPFTRWPRAADAVLAALVFLATVFLVDGPGDAIAVRPIGDVPIPALLVFAVASAALYWRRRAPLAVLGVALTAWAVTIGSGYADVGGVAIIALYSAGRHATEAQDRWAKVGVAAAVVVVLVDGLTDPAPWGEAAFGAVVMFGAWYVGRRLRLRSERAAQLLEEQAAEARRIVIGPASRASCAAGDGARRTRPRT